MESQPWKALLQDWQSRVAAYQAGQYSHATSLERRYYLLGVPVTIFAAITGTTAFPNLDKEFSYNARLTVVLVSLVAAVVSAHTFMNYGKRSEICRSVSAQLGTVRREIEILQNFPPSTPEQKETRLREVNEMIGKIAGDAPIITAPTETRRDSGSEGSGGGSGGSGGFTTGQVLLDVPSSGGRTHT